MWLPSTSLTPPYSLQENKGSVEIMRKDLNDARDLHGQAESAAAVWKASGALGPGGPLGGRGSGVLWFLAPASSCIHRSVLCVKDLAGCVCVCPL